MISSLEIPQPHFIPGYTGYCPQYKYRIGDTYGTTTHKILIDPNYKRIENLRISNRKCDDYDTIRPTFRDIDLIKKHERKGDPIYKHPMIPGYEGFIPFFNSKIGERFSIDAVASIAQHEENSEKLENERRLLEYRSAMQQDISVNGNSLGERSLKPDYRLPLSAVRPEAVALKYRTKNKEEDQVIPPPLPYSGEENSPYFMEENNPEKYLKTGCTMHVPFSWPKFGQGNKLLTKGALAEFTNDYRFRKSIEWAPIKNTEFETALNEKPQNFEIYLKNSGLIPNYTGHIPGSECRFGATFGSSTINAKQWLSKN